MKNNETKPDQAEKIEFIDHWIEVNRVISKFKIIAFIQSFGVVALAIVIGLLTSADPIVAILDNGVTTFQESYRAKKQYSKQDIENNVRTFILSRYQFDKLLPDEISADLAPIVTEGARKRFFANLAKEHKSLKGKIVRNIVADLEIVVSKEAITAEFYHIIEIDGIPLPTRKALSMQLIEGEKTRWNPAGLYINRVVEHINKEAK